MAQPQNAYNRDIAPAVSDGRLADARLYLQHQADSIRAYPETGYNTGFPRQRHLNSEGVDLAFGWGTLAVATTMHPGTPDSQLLNHLGEVNRQAEYLLDEFACYKLSEFDNARAKARGHTLRALYYYLNGELAANGADLSSVRDEFQQAAGIAIRARDYDHVVDSARAAAAVEEATGHHIRGLGWSALAAVASHL